MIIELFYRLAVTERSLFKWTKFTNYIDFLKHQYLSVYPSTVPLDLLATRRLLAPGMRLATRQAALRRRRVHHAAEAVAAASAATTAALVAGIYRLIDRFID